MIELSEEQWRRAFPIWLRTGKLSFEANDDRIDCKFNPWHDTDDGRFTFAGTGRNHGGGAGFGGAGATAAWQRPQPKRIPADQKRSLATIVHAGQPTGHSAARPAPASEAPLRAVLRNGYTYQIDSRQRTRRVSGALTVADVPIRSQTSQRQAGGAERRAGDDGGHYIAARFNGPTDAFNHFAQDANVNRGGIACSKMSGRETSVQEGLSQSKSFRGSPARPFDHR